MKIPVIWKTYKQDTIGRGYWDQAMLEDVFSREMWAPVDGLQFQHFDQFQDVSQENEGAVVVIPARHNVDYIDQINEDIKKLRWIIIILTGDEEAVFPVDKLVHPHMITYVMTPHQDKHKDVDRFLINGYTPHVHWVKNRKAEEQKIMHWFFAGQITHNRRKKMIKVLTDMDHGELIESPGFTQGLNQKEYIQRMVQARVIPCPSGAVIPDSFRIWEALELGCMPIVDNKSPKGVENYWQFVFENPPFPTYKLLKDLRGTMQYHADVYPSSTNKIYSWWQNYKRDLVYQIDSDIKDIINQSNSTDLMENVSEIKLKDRITVLIPTSPTQSHPSTEIIEKTIQSVKERLPDEVEIIIMIDGVREEQENLRYQYEEYTRRILWKANNHWENVLPVVFNEHTHQAEMTRHALTLVKTDQILFVEHDTPLCESIPFRELTNAIADKTFNMIRLHHEALILEPHKHLMVDNEPKLYHGIPILRTAQWSQRPHIAATAFYRALIANNFSPNSRTMIEDKVHGQVAEDLKRQGLAGWRRHKLGIYAPDGDMKRSYHLDGRKDDPKFEMTF